MAEEPQRSTDGRLLTRPITGSDKRRNTKSEQRAQAAAILHRRLFDPEKPTVKELAAELGISRTTASRRLALARADGVPDEARQIVIRDMLPAALAVVQEALEGSDMKVAMAAAKLVLDGLEAIQIPKPAEGSRSPVEETLEVWRERIRVVRSKPPKPAALEAGAAEAALPGSVLPAEVVYVPASGADRPSAESADDTPGVGSPRQE